MRQRQQGITAIGFLVIAAFVGLVGYGAIRLFPIYMTEMTIHKLLADLKSQNDGTAAKVSQLQSEIDKRLNIEGLDFPRRQDFVITKTDEGLVVAISYEDSVPFIANLSLTAAFEESVEILK